MITLLLDAMVGDDGFELEEERDGDGESEEQVDDDEVVEEDSGAASITSRLCSLLELWLNSKEDVFTIGFATTGVVLWLFVRVWLFLLAEDATTRVLVFGEWRNMLVEEDEDEEEEEEEKGRGEGDE
jgi:hypothetical protein